MSIAVIGAGRTGGEVASLIPASSRLGPFTSKNPATVPALQGASAAIVFVPTDAIQAINALLLEARVPCVIGTTGWSPSAELDLQLKERKLAWIIGSNFSPGMNFFFSMAKLWGATPALKDTFAPHIYELHHSGKKDSPSGTALQLQRAMGFTVPIEAERKGEHRGLHDLRLENDEEILLFRHEAKSRQAFARGAVLAARSFLPKLAPGLYRFEDLFFANLKENL